LAGIREPDRHARRGCAPRAVLIADAGEAAQQWKQKLCAASSDGVFFRSKNDGAVARELPWNKESERILNMRTYTLRQAAPLLPMAPPSKPSDALLPSFLFPSIEASNIKTGIMLGLGGVARGPARGRAIWTRGE
jgi:hypothetical protein